MPNNFNVHAIVLSTYIVLVCLPDLNVCRSTVFGSSFGWTRTSTYMYIKTQNNQGLCTL